MPRDGSREPGPPGVATRGFAGRDKANEANDVAWLSATALRSLAVARETSLGYSWVTSAGAATRGHVVQASRPGNRRHSMRDRQRPRVRTSEGRRAPPAGVAAGAEVFAEQGLSLIGRLAMATASIWLVAQMWTYRHYVVDDAYISFRYAEHVASGLGYVFNRGERVEGASNLLWVLVLAGARRLGAAPSIAAQVLGALAAVATLFFQLSLSARLSGERPSAIGPWLTALSASFALWAVAGLETAAYACVITAATLAASKDLEF